VPRVEYYFRETAAGLRRNGVVAFAAISTAFIALFLFGLALLIKEQLNLVIDAYTGSVEVVVYLTDDTNGGTSAETVGRLTSELQDLPAVASVEYESKQEAYQRFLELFSGQPAMTDQVDPNAIPASLRVHLADTTQYEQITSALGCSNDAATGQLQCTEPGVREVKDYRNLLDRLNTIDTVLSLAMLGISTLMVIAAVVLVANTLRMGQFARRKEIGIMRLVGATNWRIRVPFLIEGLVETLLGAFGAIFALFLTKVLVIDSLRESLPWLPIVRNSDVLFVVPWILVAAAVVAIVAGTVGMRRFLDV
jgi:cell division transport system permease protein